MNRAQALGWQHLTPLEKSVLSLVIVSNKTKQEASIILNIYPYKFTEIYNRSKKLFTAFTDYYDKVGDNLVPESPTLTELEISFISLIIKARYKPVELVGVMVEFQGLARTGAIKQLWDRLLRSSQLNPSDHHQLFYELLRTFDQWNNFRVLPSEYRLPSPFPRRRNREFKKIHEQLNSISELGWAMVQKKFGTAYPPLAFIPAINQAFAPIRIVLTKNSLNYCTKNRLPLFPREGVAQEFAEASYDFYSLSRVSTYSAQKFWANFRLKLQVAINYNELLNIRPGDFREFSSRDKSFLRKVTAKQAFTAPINTPQTDPNKFWQNS